MQPIFHNNPLITDGLVGAWSFKSAGQTANDVSTNSNNGTLENGTIVQKDSSFLFDGINDYVDVNNDFGRNLTISFWMKMGSTGGSSLYLFSLSRPDTLPAIRDNGDGTNRILIYLNLSNFMYSVANAFEYDRWHHVCAYVPEMATNAYIYVDGVNKSGVISDSGSIGNTGGDLRIGSPSCDGQISQVAIYDRALTEDEIKYIYKSSVPDDSLILHVDGTGKDITRFRHETTLNGDTVIGKYMEFDGSGDHILIPASDTIDSATQQVISICGWIKSPTFSTETDQCFFSFRVDPDNRQYIKGQTAGNVRIYQVINGAGSGGNSSNFLTDNTWFFVVWTIDETTNKVYSNGDLISTITLNESLSDIVGSPNFRIGTDGTSAFDFNGQVNNVKIYNRALTASEIKYMYENEKKYY